MKLHVAVADADRVVAEALSRLLHGEPDIASTCVYTDVPRLMSGLPVRETDVLVIDPAGLSTPGTALLEELRHAFPHLKILVLTAACREQQILSAVRAGVRGYVSKTVGADELLDSVRAVAQGLGALGTEEAALLVQNDLEAEERTSPLTPRQHELLCGMVQGKSYREIAGELCLTEKTVKNYTRGLFSALGVANRSDAVVRAFQLDLVSERDWLPPQAQQGTPAGADTVPRSAATPMAGSRERLSAGRSQASPPWRHLTLEKAVRRHVG